MATSSSLAVLFFYFFLFLSSIATAALLSQIQSTSLAKRVKPISGGSSTPLVLGLTHSSRTRSRSSTTRLNHHKTDIGNVESSTEEPLREIRDGYLVTLNLGTPSQSIQVYMDTGSDLIWVPCGNLSFDCIDCDDDPYYRDNSLMGGFFPTSSSSSLRVLCLSSFCDDIHSSDNSLDPCIMSGCALRGLLKGTCARPCPSFSYTYGQGGAATGFLVKDTLRIHYSASTTANTSNSSSITVRKTLLRFGCMGSTYREPLGIAGFGRGILSFPSQLELIREGFCYCFVEFKYANNPNVSSPLIIGNLAGIIDDYDSAQFTPLLSNPTNYPSYYYIGLEAITVGNQSTKQAPISLQGFDPKGDGGMVIDSGTTYTHLPESLYSTLLTEVDRFVSSSSNYPRATDREQATGFDLCYKVPCHNNSSTNATTNCINGNDDLPEIVFHFLGNVSVALPKGNSFYAMSPPNNSSVVKCFLYRVMDDGDINSGRGPAAVFGSFQQQNLRIVYDLQKERIGFKQMDCASFASSLAHSI